MLVMLPTSFAFCDNENDLLHAFPIPYAFAAAVLYIFSSISISMQWLYIYLGESSFLAHTINVTSYWTKVKNQLMTRYCNKENEVGDVWKGPICPKIRHKVHLIRMGKHMFCNACGLRNLSAPILNRGITKH
jgi:hypothetical protein